MSWLCKWYSSIFTCSVNTFFFDQEIEFSTFETTFLETNQWMNFEPNVGANVHRRALWSSGRKCPEKPETRCFDWHRATYFFVSSPTGGTRTHQVPFGGTRSRCRNAYSRSTELSWKVIQVPPVGLVPEFSFFSGWEEGAGATRAAPHVNTSLTQIDRMMAFTSLLFLFVNRSAPLRMNSHNPLDTFDPPDHEKDTNPPLIGRRVPFFFFFEAFTASMLTLVHHIRLPMFFEFFFFLNNFFWGFKKSISIDFTGYLFFKKNTKIIK